MQQRMEVRELAKNADMWNLFLLAMIDFQAIKQDQIDSYFQIAGIHGMPWTSWDGVSGSTEGKPTADMGYCPHGNLLFGTWHRPYLALFEQKLQAVAKVTASKFPTSSRARYEDAARRLRLPYWDWAKNIAASEPVMPTTLTTPLIGVTFPNGTAAQVDNPLFDYNFHPLDNRQINGTGCQRSCSGSGCFGSVPRICDESQKTIRRPTPPDGNVLESNNTELNERYLSILPSQRRQVYNLLSRYQTFQTMSNNGGCTSGSNIPIVGSFESTHDPIHANAFPGHFSPTSVSAFDPMFWLHHANVDRQIAIHQRLYPDTYIEPCTARTATFTMNAGDPLDQDSPLTPFHRNAAGDFWTSRNSRNINDFGYTYPDFADNPSNATLITRVREQYQTTTTTTTKSKRQSNSTVTETVYSADIHYPAFGLTDGNGGSLGYNILLFLGDITEKDSGKWSFADNFVGMKSTLGGVSMSGDLVSHEVMELSLALDKAIQQGKTTREDAAEYLKKNLRYRLQSGFTEVPRDIIHNVTVSLTSAEVQRATSNDVFDIWGEYKSLGLIDA